MTAPKHLTAVPSRRPLKIFATDPMLGRTAGNRITIDVPNEPLAPGPRGSRVEVIDYDGAHKRYYPPVDLNEDAILMQDGLEPSESDPRFHQQMVYAVAMKTIENFDRALGRTISFSRPGFPKLRLFPHAFHGANGYYDRDRNAVLFGYFRADKNDPGMNLPGQNVFTCLSHDVVAHEVTHAIIDTLRHYYLEPSNEDVLAFHEGFADIVAVFQHFSFHELLRDQIQKTRAKIWEPTLLVQLAQQFGNAVGMGEATRSALDKPSARLYQSEIEPHYRGSILLAAVFDGFFKSYRRRIFDLIRIATGGTGNLPDADLHPDLVNRIAKEAAHSAQTTLSICIRAFEYMPPIDVTFGDFLRALVTSDSELSPEDEFGHRSELIEAFRRRGIYPSNVASLAEESLLWEPAPQDFPRLPVEGLNMLQDLLGAASSVSKTSSRHALDGAAGSGAKHHMAQNNRLAGQLGRWASKHRNLLHLGSNFPIHVHGFHPIFRVAPHGGMVIELVLQFTQNDRTKAKLLGGIPFRGGTTVVASVDGTVRYVISKPLVAPNLPRAKRKEAEERLERQRRFLDLSDLADPSLAYSPTSLIPHRMKRRMNLRKLHMGLSS